MSTSLALMRSPALQRGHASTGCIKVVIATGLDCCVCGNQSSPIDRFWPTTCIRRCAEFTRPQQPGCRSERTRPEGLRPCSVVRIHGMRSFRIRVCSRAVQFPFRISAPGQERSSATVGFPALHERYARPTTSSGSASTPRDISRFDRAFASEVLDRRHDDEINDDKRH